mgnify:CR=1 FL=1
MTFQPTQANNDPAVCHVCGRRPIGVGIGGPKDKDPRFLCAECVQLIDHIRRVRRFDLYELQARAGGMDAAGPFVEEFGPDLSQWDEDQVLMFCGAIWRGCADRLREIIRAGEAPF